MKVTGAMLAHQARLLGRSAVRIARQPSTGAELGRLLATRGRGTLELRLPWLPFRLVDELGEILGPGSRVLEYGGGGSTLWFLDRGADVVTVEHHAGWAADLRKCVGSEPGAGERWALLERGNGDDWGAYVGAATEYPRDHFDLVLVDGRHRVRCAVAAAPHVRPGGLLLLDDVDRPEYSAAFREVPWARRDVVGFAPAKPSLGYTAVLTRPRGR